MLSGRWMYAIDLDGWDTAGTIEVISRILGFAWLAAACWVTGKMRDRIPIGWIREKTLVVPEGHMSGAG